MKNNNFVSRTLSILFCALILITGCKSNQDEGWINLLDKDLSQWTIYQSYEKMNPNGTPIANEDGSIPDPIGYDVNKENVFSTVEENGELLLHIKATVNLSIDMRTAFAYQWKGLRLPFYKREFPKLSFQA